MNISPDEIVSIREQFNMSRGVCGYFIRLRAH
ncbi:virulence gene repressor RsaL [Vibrio cholerae]|nr:virulence gene repressor RsaL [Vibrio cholerae]